MNKQPRAPCEKKTMLKASDLKVDFTIQKIASFEITLFHPITVFPCVMNRHVPLEIAVNYACVKLL